MNRNGLSSLGGLAIALGLPAFAILKARAQADLPDTGAAILLAVTPWLILGWVVLAERRPLSGIGLRRPGWRTLGFGLVGAAVNVGISVAVGAIDRAVGFEEAQSALMTQLIQGAGWFLVLMVTNGAVLTEIAFRAYALTRIGELSGGRLWLSAAIQIALTTALFIAARGLAHGLIWFADDLVFTLFFLWRRDTAACLVAHAVPNFLASTLVALGLAA